MHLAHIGFNSSIDADKVVIAVHPEYAPIKRFVREAKEKGKVIDATYGHPTRGVLIKDNGYCVLSALQLQTLTGRLREADLGTDEE